MLETESKFELFGVAHVRAADWTVEDVAGFEIARMGETRRIANKYKNSGNEAKNYLKTKDITF